MDIALEVAGDVSQLAQFAEALLHEYDLRGVGSNRGRPAQRNRDIGLLQCDRVIDAVANKADLAAFLLQFLDVSGLVRGRHCHGNQIEASGERGKMVDMAPLCYRRHRFPPQLIQHAIWLYLRFTLSYRDVEQLLADRGLDISYETVRRWVLKFGPAIARRLRQCRPQPSNR